MISSKIKWALALTVFAALVRGGFITPEVSATTAATERTLRATVNRAGASVFFEENRGQFPDKARFLARGTGGYDLFLTDRDAVYVIREQTARTSRTDGNQRMRGSEEFRDEAPSRATAVFMSLAGANGTIATEGTSLLNHRTNYFKGEESNWRTEIPNFSQVRMNGVYDGIDAVWHGRESGGVQYDFVIEPNADPNQIEWNIAGANDVALDGDGNLVISTEFGAIRQNKPFTFQETDGVRVEVASSFVLEPKFAENGAKSFSVKFEVGNYDRTKPLTIDPSVNLSNLSFSTFLGGNTGEGASAIDVDQSGNVYVGGHTFSVTFPMSPGTFDTSHNGSSDVFVAKMNAAGTSLIFSTFIGGSDSDQCFGMTVDSSGSVFITGGTTDGAVDFPTTSGVFDSTPNGASDVYVTKLNPAGSALAYSTLLGGGAADVGNGIAIDALGNAVVTGYTTIGPPDFPATSGSFDPTHNGSTDIFVSKLNSAGTILTFSTFMGGSSGDIGEKVVLDSSGNIYVTGYTGSSNYPTTAGAFDVTHNGSNDAVVSKLNASGSALAYSTFIGGTGADLALDVAIDSSGNAFITGRTDSTNFPVSFSYDNTHNGLIDVFVTKLNPAGSFYVYSTFIGGAGFDSAKGIAVDSSGYAYITGSADDNPTAYPTTAGAFDTTPGGLGSDAIFTKLNFAGSALTYSTFLGGLSSDDGVDVTTDSAGNVFVVGYGAANFPTTPEVIQPANNGGTDAFIAKFGDYSISGRSIDQTGAPLANVAVQMSGLQSGFMLTDANGYFCFSDTANSGTIWVSATSTLYNFTPNTFEINQALPGNFVLQFLGRPVTSVPTVAYGPVGGAVTSTAGNIGLPFTELSIVDVRGNVRTTTTDANGGYRFDNIRLGEMYVIHAERDGFNFEPATAVVNLMTSDLNINFAARPAISRPLQDFDGDGKSDLAVFRPSEGNWYIRDSQTDKMRVVRFGLAGDIPVAEDFDGDGRADITVFRPSDGNWYRLNSSDGGFFAMNFGMNGDVPVPADYDGDGKTDIAVFRPADGVWHVLNSSDGRYTGLQWGLPGDRPVPADFDSDGRADFTVFREGTWYRFNSSDNSYNAYRFGLEGDRPSAADFDGDGRPDTAVFRPSDGTWHWLDNLDGEYHAVQYGGGTDKPIPADFNGDGRLEQAVYRAGTWYRLFPDGTSAATHFGGANDIPLSRMR